MTISTTDRKAGPFAGNDVTVAFPFTFKVFSTADLYVISADSVGAETVLVLASDFTVSLNADQDDNPGGTLTMLTAPATGTTLTIASDIDITQPVELTNMGGFYPTVINTALDRITMILQQLSESFARCVKFSISTPSDEVTELPSDGRASKAIGFDAAGALTVFAMTTGTTLIELAQSSGSALIGFIQSGVGAVLRTVQSKLRERMTALDFGAVADGVTDDAVACLAADTAASSGGVIYTAGVYYINTNTTLTSPITMMPGARFKVNAGKVLTINAPVYAGSGQYIFEGASGAVAGSFGNVGLWVDWFGAVSDCVISTGAGTNNTTAFQTALDAAEGTVTGLVQINPGDYLVSTQITIASGVRLVGSGMYVSRLVAPTSFTSSDGLIKANGVGGPPTTLEQFSVLGQTTGGAGAGSAAIHAVCNAVNMRHLWCGGFTKMFKITGTDCHCINCWADVSLSGGVGFEVWHGSNVLEECEAYNCYVGVTVADSLLWQGEPDTGVKIVNCSFLKCGYRAITLDAARNVSISNCHIHAESNVSYSNAGIFIVNGTNININQVLIQMAGTPSATCIGIYQTGTTEKFSLTNSSITDANIGVSLNDCVGGIVSGNHFDRNGLGGLLAVTTANVGLVISGNTADFNGTAATFAANTSYGFNVPHSVANGKVTLAHNSASDFSGEQYYGFYLNCGASSNINFIGNTCVNTGGGLTFSYNGTTANIINQATNV